MRVGRIICIVLAIVFLLCLLLSAASSSMGLYGAYKVGLSLEPLAKTKPTGAKSAVVFHSVTGHSRALALSIAKAQGADVFEVRPPGHRAPNGYLDEFVRWWALAARQLGYVAPWGEGAFACADAPDVSGYADVHVVTPVHFGGPSHAMASWAGCQKAKKPLTRSKVHVYGVSGNPSNSLGEMAAKNLAKVLGVEPAEIKGVPASNIQSEHSKAFSEKKKEL